MPANTSPIFPVSPISYSANLTVTTACTSRAPQTHANMVASAAPAYAKPLVPTSTNGVRIDSIRVQGAATAITGATAACVVLLWISDGTTAYVIDEIPVTVTTPSTTVAAFTTTKVYQDLVIPGTHYLYASTTIACAAASSALVVTARGGAY